MPFSWLDPSSTLAQIRSGSLFVADIPALENRGASAPPVVLAARLSGDAGVYVIERVKAGIYSLSKLGAWVGEGEILVAAKGGLDVDYPGTGTGAGSVAVSEGGAWWEAAKVEDPSSAGLGPSSAASDVSLVFGADEGKPGLLDPALERRSSSDANLLTPLESSQGKGEAAISEDVGGPPDSLQSPQDLLDALREQYLQALYVSKVSLDAGDIGFVADLPADFCCLLCQRAVGALSCCVPIL